MAKDTSVAPRLSPGSVDFNKLHDACRAGKSAKEAVETATIGRVNVKREAAETAAAVAPAVDKA